MSGPSPSRLEGGARPVPAGPGGASLAGLTTLGVGGPAAELVTARTWEEVVDVVARADRAGRPLMVLGGGSNVVIGDAGFDGTVVRPAAIGRQVTVDGDAALVTVEAGEVWVGLVDLCVAEKLSGIECLAGIPGLVGAVPVQNVGAYGQEIASTVVNVRAWDRQAGRVVDLDPPSCRFGYRTSKFRHRARWVILSVTFRLRRSELSEPIRYPQLANALGVGVGDRLPLGEVRDAVVGLRRSKGMVLDPADPDTRSVGSFFTNPVLEPDELAGLRRRAADRLGETVAVPVFPAEEGRSKVPAAWLIEQAGFPRGYQVGAARISTKHTLALTVLDGRSAEPLLALARIIRKGVDEAFGVTLEPEPILVGASL